MYDPISGNDDDQYIELYNQGTNTVSLANWQFTAGVNFTFPPNASIGPNGYVVVGQNTAELFSNYPNLNPANTYGNYSGKLSHNGERVALSMPQSLYGTNTIYVVEDEVTYGTGGRWGEWSSGGGSSLELIDPHGNHRLAANWADSDESQKSSWVDIENTGVLDNGANYEVGIAHAQIGLLDAGECLVDNVRSGISTATNYVANSTFEVGPGQLVTPRQPRPLQPGEFRLQQQLLSAHSEQRQILAGGKFLPGRFDRQQNGGGQHGHVELSRRAGCMAVPNPISASTAIGSKPPAFCRSRPISARRAHPTASYVTNAGPAIYQVTHTPSRAGCQSAGGRHGQASTIRTACRASPSIIEWIPPPTYTAVPMNDNGTGGDAMARDGIFSATIPGQAANTIVAFYLSADRQPGRVDALSSLARQRQ